MLNSDDPYICSYSLKALEKIGNSSVIAELKNILDSNKSIQSEIRNTIFRLKKKRK